MFEKKQNLEELNKTMSTIIAKQDVSPYDNEETNNAQIEEERYQQMNLIRL